jgi:hypothetical protein
MNTVMRTEPLDGPDGAAWAPRYAFRKRLDGGYNIANGELNVVDIVPNSLRFGREFLPALRLEWRALRPRFGSRHARSSRRSRRHDVRRSARSCGIALPAMSRSD